ncbi:class I SAM-dependent methyltransferase [Fulvivirga lutea]|uniref:Methyltransferase domain-containing protein n=1 Tax=Fulvivirga lutea TaxID=2810512 RepID=A0A975A2L6_9BACT|nr:class I SAM-dependent methyltransferase [Fulvivirga lutea]QSE98667.1 methyltransferase domain-containing protein [Fulvivirga lutea]
MIEAKPYYDQIGINYSNLRKPDSRIQSSINKELATAKTVLNIGAGTGSYEPKNKDVIAVEPSEIMIKQRPYDAAPVIKASAENLPFSDKQFDWAIGILTIHHWDDLELGLSEMQRTSHNQLLFTWDPDHPGFWMSQDYFPEVLQIDKSIFPAIGKIQRILKNVEVIKVPIPFDCSDGFGSAYWRRPEAYLSSNVRNATSTFNKIKNTEMGLLKLSRDLQSGFWFKKYGHLLELTEIDLGFCILISKNSL